jgi:hypothetical protein
MDYLKVAAIFGIVFILLQFIPLAKALEDSDADYLIKQYSSFDIKRTCIYNSTQCSYAATCNITINYLQGNGTLLYNNTQMSNKGAYHNLTLKSIDTQYSGWYQTYITCHDQDGDGSEIFYYRVTSTGDENSTTFFIILGLVCAMIIVFGYAVKNEYIVFIGGAAALILGIYSMIYGFGSTANDFTYMLSIVIIGLGVIFIIQPAYHLLENEGQTGYEEVIDITEE